MWVALLFTVILSAGTSILNGLINAVSGISVLSSSFASLLAAGYDFEEAIEQMIWAYSAQMGAVIGTIAACSLLTSLLGWLWNGLMSVGFEGYCLSMVRCGQPSPGKLFCGFPLIGKVLLTQLLVWVFTMLWSLLYGVGFAVIAVIAALLMEKVAAVGAILMVLGCAAVVVLEIRLSLRYAMANYVLLDQGKYGLEAVTESKLMMKGNKGRLFMLQLSFIGWYLVEMAIVWVGIIVLVVIVWIGGGSYMFAGSFSYGAMAGMLGGVMVVCVLMSAACILFSSWLRPYYTGSVAKFYDFLMGQRPRVEPGWPALDGGTYTRTDGTSGGPNYPQY